MFYIKFQKSFIGEEFSEFKKDGELFVVNLNVREYQKVRVKKKNIERRNYEIFVIYFLSFGEN